MKKEISDSELNLERLLNTITGYKWLIISFMLLASILMFVNLYFIPSVYASSSILEIKSKSKPKLPNDILLGALSFGGTGKVEKEMEILRTFLVNEKALEKTNFTTQYFKTKNYKKVELYESAPIQVSNVLVHDIHLIGKEITLHPQKDHFTLSIKNSLKDSLLSYISSPSFIEFENNKKYNYNEEISNEFCQFTVKKNRSFKEPIIFTLAGNNRQVYENIIQNNLHIKQINPNAPLIEIMFEDTIPQRADDYINALSQSFIEISVNAKNEQNSKVLTFINQQLERIKTTLQSSENELEAYKTKNKIIQPSIQAKKYIEKLSALEINLSENTLKEKLIENLIAFSKNNTNLDAIAPSLMELNDKPTLGLIRNLQELQTSESNLRTELTDMHPQLITVRNQMSTIRNKILYNLKNLKSLIKQQNHSLQQEKTSYVAKIKDLPKEQKQLVNINRNYEVSSSMYNYLLKKKTESELLMVSTLSDYKVIDKAHVNRTPIKPKKTLMMIVAPLIGLLLGVILATILSSLNKKVTSPDHLAQLTDLPLLAIIPFIKKKNIKLEVYENSNSEFTESYRTLRSHLPVKHKDELAKVIVTTSTVPDEGKSTLISNLSSVLQMANYKTIVLNLDLRKPTLHKHFELKNEKGMSTYLSGKDSIQDIIFATKHTNLHVITSGPIPSHPSELILSYKLPELIEILKERYDYILIDSAPVGLVSDSIYLMQLADQNIVVVRENFAKKSFFKSLHNLMEKNNLKNVGLVLNQSRNKHKSDNYGYGYGYGYGEQ